jgi:hypothetical protein
VYKTKQIICSQSDDHTTTNDILEMAWDNDVSQQNHQSSSDIEQETCLIQQNVIIFILDNHLFLFTANETVNS